ncbi:hypothetical protein NEMBOFW57_010615 [Staphylotrichum longicolle]|uniref:C2H2-type domain-containing protein n=1 Tax=Staphylotrichum longicolle TaxID=669026 RepID=A0AAD4HUY3_9PEZI|nr:hypothetical protein NEMBOFW57_010615 [Staphylotrichum longicolle]
MAGDDGQGLPDEATMLLEIVTESVRSLFRIAILVRKAGPDDRFSRALKMSKTAFPESFDINHAQEKYPKLRLGGAGLLANRVGSAISKRRQFIKYSRDHRYRLGHDDVEGVPESTATELLSSKAKRIHAFRDLKAYVCTIGGKECDSKLFEDRNSWFEHELRQHRAQYACNLCNDGHLSSEQDLTAHIGTRHGIFGREQLQLLLDASRQTPARIPAAECPFCDAWEAKLCNRGNSANPEHDITAFQDGGPSTRPLVSLSRFKRHVAMHQEDLASFAVPRATENTGTTRRSSDGSQSTTSISLADWSPVASSPSPSRSPESRRTLLELDAPAGGAETPSSPITTSIVASVEDADESGNIIEGTNPRYASSVAPSSPAKEQRNTRREGSIVVSAEDEQVLPPLFIHHGWDLWDIDGHLARADQAKIVIDARDKYGQTPLWWAAANGHEAVVKLLLGTGKVDVDARDKNGRTSLWWAARNRREAVIEVLKSVK